MAQTANTGKGVDCVVLAGWGNDLMHKREKYEEYTIRYLDMSANYGTSWEQRSHRQEGQRITY